MRLLIAEDDPRLLRSLAHILKQKAILSTLSRAATMRWLTPKAANTTGSCSTS